MGLKKKQKGGVDIGKESKTTSMLSDMKCELVRINLTQSLDADHNNNKREKGRGGWDGY